MRSHTHRRETYHMTTLMTHTFALSETGRTSAADDIRSTRRILLVTLVAIVIGAGLVAIGNIAAFAIGVSVLAAALWVVVSWAASNLLG